MHAAHARAAHLQRPDVGIVIVDVVGDGVACGVIRKLVRRQDGRVVLEVLADAGQVGNGVDAKFGKLSCRADA
jgi:hypothetical protein